MAECDSQPNESSPSSIQLFTRTLLQLQEAQQRAPVKTQPLSSRASQSLCVSMFPEPGESL